MYYLVTHIHTYIYSWIEIQLIPILEREVERISQQPQQTQTNLSKHSPNSNNDPSDLNFSAYTLKLCHTFQSKPL